MSKPIIMTKQYLDECRADFEKALQLTKLADGKLSFTKTFTCGDRKAIVYFTADAWAKMVMLIKNFDKEVAWHGVASRVEDGTKDEYIISDILVYPQTVTGATVEMDTEEYALWLMENVEDERFNNIHMQGHSHVNMGTSPSSVDLTHQEEILNMLENDNFYIFMIWNKSFTDTTKIYDLKKNVLFEDGDITVKLIGAGEDLDEFYEAAKGMVRTKTYASTPAANYGGNYGYGSYGKQPSGPYNPLPATPASKPADKKDDGQGKREKTRTRICAGYEQGTLFDQEDDDSYQYPYAGYRGYGR